MSANSLSITLQKISVGAGAGAFVFSAKPVVLAPEPPEQSLFGLPGLRVFGAHYQSKHLAALLAATLFLGLKGFLIGNAVWVVYKLSQTQGEQLSARSQKDSSLFIKAGHPKPAPSIMQAPSGRCSSVLVAM